MRQLWLGDQQPSHSSILDKRLLLKIKSVKPYAGLSVIAGIQPRSCHACQPELSASAVKGAAESTGLQSPNIAHEQISKLLAMMQYFGCAAFRHLIINCFND